MAAEKQAPLARLIHDCPVDLWLGFHTHPVNQFEGNGSHNPPKDVGYLTAFKSDEEALACISISKQGMNGKILVLGISAFFILFFIAESFLMRGLPHQ